MADMFYFCSPRADVKYAVPSSRRFRKPVRKSPHALARMERACMARFAEPVFRSNGLFSFHDDDCSDQSLAMDGSDDFPGDSLVHLDGEAAEGPCDGRQQTYSDNLIDDDAMLATPLKNELHPERNSWHPRPESDDTLREEDRRRRRVAFDAHALDDLPQPGLATAPTVPSTRSRVVFHQPSCNSLRNMPSMQSQHALADTRTDHGDTSLPEDARLQDNNSAQYTIVTDMVETAWSVDDPRYGADVLDSIQHWGLYVRQHAELAFSLHKRAIPDSPMLPAFRRREMFQLDVDMQGIEWNKFGASRKQELINRTYLDQPSGPRHKVTFDWSPDETGKFYSFHYFNGLKRPKWAHHQLRHVLTSTGRDIHYANSSKVMQASLACPSSEETVLDLTRSRLTSSPIHITCLASTDSIILAGGFEGEYALRNLDLDPSNPHSEGLLTAASASRNSLVTHIDTFAHRLSGLPRAAFSSNDQRLRLMDLATEQITNTFAYEHSLNNSATASSGRLRALASDSPDALVTNADTGEVLVSLQCHTDHIFACAWSPDERHLATGAQDGKIALWDSRNWARPLAEIRSAGSCSRSLHFTSDSRLLVSAENEDVVSIFDTGSPGLECQDVRFFGTIAGVALVGGGEEVVVANGDRTVGGLMSFRREGGGDGYGRRGRGRGGRREGVVEEFVV